MSRRVGGQLEGPQVQARVPEIEKAYSSISPAPGNAKGPQRRAFRSGVSDGTRTRDRLDHNQELYQLSYTHRVRDGV